MDFHDIIDREVRAFKVDRSYQDMVKEFKSDNPHRGTPLQWWIDFEEEMSKYPSIQERFRRVVGFGRRNGLSLSCSLSLQRLVRGWSHKDAMLFNAWFIKVVPDMLRYYRDHAKSVPWEFWDEENNDGQAWNDEIDTMIEGFERYAREIDAYYEGSSWRTIEEENDHYEAIHQRLAETLERFAKNFRHLSW